MAEWLLVVSADLRRQGSTVVVGPETARVCDKAAEVAEKNPKARICVPAGWSRKYDVHMGDGPVRTYLLDTCGIERSRIVTPSYGQPCTTNGEMAAFARLLNKNNDMRPRITLVVRWWHAPRARALLKARLRDEAVRPETIDTVPVRSLHYDILLHEPIALVTNLQHYF